MKIAFSRGSTAPTVFQLTRQDIEQQAITDLSKYGRLFQEQHKKQMAYPVDVDHMAQLLWGATVVYEDIEQSEVEEETLGYYDHSSKRIVVDPVRCKNDGRTTFTVAHELGHLSLHGFLMTFPRQLSRTKKDHEHARLEWQATRYAVSVLAPRQRVVDVLRSLSLVEFGTFLPVDLNIHATALQNSFGLSRQALEIRLEELGVSTLNRKYS